MANCSDAVYLSSMSPYPSPNVPMTLSLSAYQFDRLNDGLHVLITRISDRSAVEIVAVDLVLYLSTSSIGTSVS